LYKYITYILKVLIQFVQIWYFKGMRITLIGSGNVATHLGAALKNAGHYIAQVYSPDLQHAALLAYHIKAEAINDLQQISPETDVFIIAIKR
jgi:pyrroline-5-carboxylate reductase